MFEKLHRQDKKDWENQLWPDGGERARQARTQPARGHHSEESPCLPA